MKSFNDQVPSRENIIAMEDCDIDVITHSRMLELMERVPAWRQIAKDVDEFKYNALMNRSIQLQTLTASERYQLFVKKYPDILQKVALKHIASYLGIDIATLSRIRKSI
jgi:CRP-like cAMP-binding protein